MLDINSPLGIISAQHEKQAYAIFEKQRQGYTIRHTDKTKPISYDGWIIYKENPVALVETKCRDDCLYHEFVQKYKNYWLISESKLLVNADKAKVQKLPLYGFLYIVRSKVLMVVKLCNAGGQLTAYEAKLTKTKKTINGGSIERMNAYIPMRSATILQWFMTGHRE